MAGEEEIEQLMRAMSGDAIPAQAARASRAELAPRLSYGRQFGPMPANARDAAIVAPIFCRDGQWRTTLTRRPDSLKNHGGQVCFPGGVREAGESDWECAQREWTEELGPPDSDWTRLGVLNELYVFVSHHVVRPCVAYMSPPEKYEPDPREVAAVIETPLEVFLAPEYRDVHKIERWGTTFDSPCYSWQDECIWGATAMILGELSARLRAVRFQC